MLSASPSMIVRSSLEEMLDSLRRRDEEEKPKDLPPALPARPTSKARLPPARRSLPTNFRVGDDDDECLPSGNEETKRKENDSSGSKRNCFATKKMRKDQNAAESPYAIGIELTESSDRAAVASMRRNQGTDLDDNISYFMKKKRRVWCRLPSGQWESGTIQSTSGEHALVSLSNGNVMKISSSELLPANPDILEGVDDLVQLSYLNEPSLFHNLRNRFSNDLIYTKAGPVLVAINPFKDVQIYGDEFVTAYRQKRLDSPHVYAVVDAAYDAMMKEEVNQSIIISGESGAGKTETAKIAMQYLATLSGGSSSIEHKMLQSNLILEAFGNAKTSRNGNSSRFGKLIEIHFSTLGKIYGANIEVFLLDKSRVVQLANGERSYHVFYQLCAGAPSSLKERLNLRMASDYKYLSQSDCLAIEGVNEAQRFHILMEALDIVGISKEDQERIFATLAAILWLGNTSFQVIDNGNQVEVLVDEAVTNAAKLMGCSIQELKLSLCTNKNLAGKESVTKRWTLQQAIDRRDALAKFIYARLFDWLVERINNSLHAAKRRVGKSINILDIYGFESFQKNSFEQMCINYANERLQQHFNRHLFKLEQEDYELDGIDWTKVDFEDNQECLDLFEKKSSGLLSVLDAESNLPKASDLTFANKLKQHLNLNSRFKGERGRAFSVRHYAGEVLYDTNGFLEKNKDSLHADFLQLLSACNNELLQIASKLLNDSEKPATTLSGISSSDFPRQSVSTKFKNQLFKLMQRLDSTKPHFIRCIKPNNKQLPGIYQADLVLEQLRCGGILEVVRIARSGHPIRMKHQEFARRYGFLLSKTNVAQDPLSISIAILQQFGILPEMYQIGYTKVFLRMGQIEKLEHRRKQVLEGTVCVQKHFRGYHARCCLYELKGAKKSKSCNDTHLVKELQPDGLKSIKKPGRKFSEGKEERVHKMPLTLKELQQRVIKAEETIEQKEEENAALREQLQQFEMRWSDYEVKMKSMEEMWQKQMASLQMSLAAARKSLGVDHSVGQPGRHDAATSPRYYDSEDATSMGSRTPGASTPLKYSNSGHDVGVGRDTNGTLSAVSNLMKEFEQQRQAFDNDAKALVDVKPGQSASNKNSDAELRMLKSRFEMWKKEYKVRLRETKAKLHRLGHSEAERSRRKWWGRISARAS